MSPDLPRSPNKMSERLEGSGTSTDVETDPSEHPKVEEIPVEFVRESRAQARTRPPHRPRLSPDLPIAPDKMSERLEARVIRRGEL